MKHVLLLFCGAYPLFTTAHAQDLTGIWQGVEFFPPRTVVTPTVITFRSGIGKSVSGVIYQQAGNDSTNTIRFHTQGTLVRNSLRVDKRTIISETTPQGGTWCTGYIEFEYDASEEKLSGTSTYTAGGCRPGTFNLFRIKLKSPATVLQGSTNVLRVSGRQVKWFTDPTLRHLVAIGNSYRTRLTRTTTYYLTQGFYTSRQSKPVPVTILVKQLSPSHAPRASQAFVVAPAIPILLPTVRFYRGTAILLPTASPPLLQLAADLNAEPSMQLRVAGHTDRLGDPNKNQILSEQRAAAVKQFLINAGIPAGRISTVGYGDARPIHPSPDARNRRVEVEVVR